MQLAFDPHFPSAAFFGGNGSTARSLNSDVFLVASHARGLPPHQSFMMIHMLWFFVEIPSLKLT